LTAIDQIVNGTARLAFVVLRCVYGVHGRNGTTALYSPPP
jgi:hypothetical protein